MDTVNTLTHNMGKLLEDLSIESERDIECFVRGMLTLGVAFIDIMEECKKREADGMTSRLAMLFFMNDLTAVLENLSPTAFSEVEDQ